MKNNKVSLKGKAKWIIGIAVACILLYLGLENIGAVANAVSWVVGLFSPLIIGFFIALVLNVPMKFFENHLWQKSKKKFAAKVRRPVAFILSLILILGILIGVIWLIIPELAAAFKVVGQSAIEILRRLEEMDRKSFFESSTLGKAIASVNWDKIIAEAEGWIKAQSGNIVNIAMDTVVSLVGGIINFFFAIIFSIYILFSKEILKAQAKRLIKAWLPQRHGDRIIHAASVANGVFRNFISGQTIEAFILGSLCAIGMLILRIPYAPMVGALVGVCALIPVVGAFIAGAVGAFMIFTESPIKALIFIIFLIILQQLEGNLIYPKVMGSKINLPAIWVLASVTIGGALAGPLGILLGIPLSSTAYVLIREATEKREQMLTATSAKETQENTDNFE